MCKLYFIYSIGRSCVSHTHKRQDASEIQGPTFDNVEKHAWTSLSLMDSRWLIQLSIYFELSPLITQIRSYLLLNKFVNFGNHHALKYQPLLPTLMFENFNYLLQHDYSHSQIFANLWNIISGSVIFLSTCMDLLLRVLIMGTHCTPNRARCLESWMLFSSCCQERTMINLADILGLVWQFRKNKFVLIYVWIKVWFFFHLWFMFNVIL